MSDLDALVGRTVEAAYVDGPGVDCKIYLVFVDGSSVALVAGADCCAHCWVADVDGADALLLATVLSVEDLEIAPYDLKDGETGDVEEVWGHRIITTRGTCTIGMRLSHNGYYGGQLSVRDVEMSDAPEALIPLADFS